MLIRDKSFMLRLQSLRPGWKVVLTLIGIPLAICLGCGLWARAVDTQRRCKAAAEERRERRERRAREKVERERREKEEAKANAPKIAFKVRELTGKEDAVETLGALHTITELRQEVARLTGKGVDEFDLVWKNKLLKDGEETLGSHGIEEGVEVVMTAKLPPQPEPQAAGGLVVLHSADVQLELDAAGLNP